MPNGHKIYQHFRFKGSPKYIQICIFGLKSICTIWQPWLAYDLIKKPPSFCQEFANTIVLDRDHTWFRIAMLSGHSHICTYICIFSVQSVTKGTETLFFSERSSKWNMLCQILPIGWLVGWLVNLASLAMFGWYRLGYFDPLFSKILGRKLEGKTGSQSMIVYGPGHLNVCTYVCMHVCMMLWLFTQGWDQL
jgi:hypothetical protein